MKDFIKYFCYLSVMILFFASIAVWLIIPEYTMFNSLLTVMTSCGISLLIFYSRKDVGLWLKSGQARKFSGVTLNVFLVFCILGILNYLAYKNFYQKDLTANKLNSLTEQSVNVVKKFDKPLKIKIFIGRDNQAPYLKLIELYQLHKRDISIEVIDPELHPEIVKTHNVNRYGTIILEGNGKKVVAESPSELDVTKAILKLKREHEPLVSFIQGHEEESINDKSEEGISYFADLLKNQGNAVEEINLLALERISDKTDLLVLWGPKRDLNNDEVMKIRDYLSRGKRLLMAANPDFSGLKLKKVQDLLKEYGVVLNNDVVLDLASYTAGSNYMVPIVREYGKEHPATKDFREQTFFTLPLSLDFNFEKKEAYLLERLVQTSGEGQSFAKKKLEDILDKKFDFIEGQDEIGPKALMVSVEEKLKDVDRSPIKMIILGTSSLISNKFINYLSQYHLILNAVSWLTDEDFTITVDRPAMNDKTIYMNSYQVGFLFYSSIIVMPFALVMMAIFFYLRRKKL